MAQSLKNSEIKDMTSVSRSGRVRKKSSKLMGFESPDDLVDSKVQKLPKTSEFNSNTKINDQNQAENDKNSETHDNPPIVKVEIKTEPEEILGCQPNVIIKEEDRHFVAINIKEEVDPLYIDEREINYADLESANQEKSRISNVVLLEKNKKKSAINYIKISERTKAPRSDKGKTRITSYMLWARDVRQDLLKKNPNMDFATISKKLAERWASVTPTEKYNLRRRAKRLAAKSKQ